jgi:glycosyltransferase involved in cell wall biosynthesis
MINNRRIAFVCDSVPFPARTAKNRRTLIFLQAYSSVYEVDLIACCETAEDIRCLRQLAHEIPVAKALPTVNVTWNDRNDMIDIWDDKLEFIHFDTLRAISLFPHTNLPYTLDEDILAFRCYEQASTLDTQLSIQALALRLHELAMCQSARMVFVSSIDDKKALNEAGVSNQISVVPPCWSPKYWINRNDMKSAFKHNKQIILGFTGNLSLPANEDAIRNWISIIAPKLTGKCSIRLLVIGTGAPIDILMEPEIVWCPSKYQVCEILEATDIFIRPLRLSPGYNAEVVEAWAIGVPIISTEMGSRGVLCSSGEDIIIENDAGLFAEAILTLAGDDSLRYKLIDNGRRRVAQFYRSEDVLKILEDLIKTWI